MKNTLQNNTQSDNISEEINKMFLELQINDKIKYYEQKRQTTKLH